LIINTAMPKRILMIPRVMPAADLQVLDAPPRGSAVVGFSTQESPVSNALDLDPSNQWIAALNNPSE